MTKSEEKVVEMIVKTIKGGYPDHARNLYEGLIRSTMGDAAKLAAEINLLVMKGQMK